MPTKDEAKALLDGICSKFDDPGMKAQFAGYDRTLEFKFTDLDTSFHTRIHDQSMDFWVEGALEKPNMLVTTDSGTIKGILEGSLSPLDAYSMGKLKVKGSMTDLLKLQVLM
ncbi:MAG: SCP2 sterol-binding domain-containing protein [Promethearchaeota archaeon]